MSKRASLSVQGGEIGRSEEREGRRRVSASQPGREGGREGFIYELAARSPSQQNRRCTLQGCSRCSPSRPAHSAESVDDPSVGRLNQNRKRGVCHHEMIADERAKKKGGSEEAEGGREEGRVSLGGREGGRGLYSNLQRAHHRSRTAAERSRIGAAHSVGG